MSTGRNRVSAPSKTASRTARPLAHKFVDVADHDHAVEDGHAEERDEPHACGDRERQPSQSQREDAADDRERDARIDDERLSDGAERTEQQDENQDERHGHYDQRAR